MVWLVVPSLPDFVRPFEDVTPLGAGPPQPWVGPAIGFGMITRALIAWPLVPRVVSVVPVMMLVFVSSLSLRLAPAFPGGVCFRTQGWGRQAGRLKIQGPEESVR